MGLALVHFQIYWLLIDTTEYQESYPFQDSNTLSLINKINGDQTIRQSKCNHVLFSHIPHLQAPVKFHF